MAYRLLTKEGHELDTHFDLKGTQIIIHSRAGVKGGHECRVWRKTKAPVESRA